MIMSLVQCNAIYSVHVTSPGTSTSGQSAVGEIRGEEKAIKFRSRLKLRLRKQVSCCPCWSGSRPARSRACPAADAQGAHSRRRSSPARARSRSASRAPLATDGPQVRPNSRSPRPAHAADCHQWEALKKIVRLKISKKNLKQVSQEINNCSNDSGVQKIKSDAKPDISQTISDNKFT